MIVRLFSLLLIIAVVYTVAIFVTPTLADRYGNTSWNDRIRSLKGALENETGTLSIYQQFKNTTENYVQESQSTVEHIQATVTSKTEEVKSAAASVQNAYSAVEKAKDDLQKLGNFSTGGNMNNTGSR